MQQTENNSTFKLVVKTPSQTRPIVYQSTMPANVDDNVVIKFTIRYNITQYETFNAWLQTGSLVYRTKWKIN